MKQLPKQQNNLDEDALKAFACDMAMEIKHPKVIALFGDLGVGKSTFSRSFIQTKSGERTIVSSPTFTIVNEYNESTPPIAHFDLYRLADADELYEINFFEFLKTHICLIEWPQIAQSFLPSGALELHISQADEFLRDIEIKYVKE